MTHLQGAANAMTAYLPSGATIVGLAAALLAVTVLAGFAIDRCLTGAAARIAAWTLVLAATVAIERLCAAEPPGFRMLAIIGVALFAVKAPVLAEARADGGTRLRVGRWLGFVAAWPGMQPRPFADPDRPALAGARDLVALGFRRLGAGVMLVAIARGIWLATGSALLATVPLLPGLSLILHFGLFNILAGAWRFGGVNLHPLFRAPLLSKSLTEFWGRRWNLAFSEMTAIAVYRPLAARFGNRPALAASFLFSGLLHELAISVPVRAGFGLPLLYFLLHGGLMMVERELTRRRRPIGGRFGRVWTIVWLIAPLPILFHPPFLTGVVWPLIGIDIAGG